MDLVEKKSAKTDRNDDELTFANCGRRDAFPRDCCMLLENIFYARGEGIEISTEMLRLLKDEQSGKREIDRYAIFGVRSDGSADGRTGSWLEISGHNANRFLSLVREAKPGRTSMVLCDEKRVVRQCKCT